MNGLETTSSVTPAYVGRLRDHHGYWCAWCLRYIDRVELEKHHMAPTAAVEVLVGKPLEIPWVVPAHKYSCHRNDLHRLSGLIIGILQRRRDAFPGGDNHVSAALHNDSQYWTNLIFLEACHGTAIQENPKAYRLNLTKSAAGVKRGAQFAKDLIPDHGALNDTECVIAEANLEFSSGSKEKSQHYVAWADSRLANPSSCSDSQFGALLRRKAQLEPANAKLAREAMAASADQPYTRATATLYLAWNEYLRGNHKKALHRLDSMRPATGLPWLYRAELLLAYALCDLAQNLLRPAIFQRLIAVQYICAMLGLVAPSWRFLGKRGPTDILLDQPSFLTYDPQTCYQLREEVIAGKNREELAKEILGRGHLRDRIFDFYDPLTNQSATPQKPRLFERPIHATPPPKPPSPTT